MILISEHTARSTLSRRCACCNCDIRAGDRYRSRRFISDDSIDARFALQYAHDFCVVLGSGGWELRSLRDSDTDGLDTTCEYVRKRYGLDVYFGASVTAIGKPGRVVGATNHVYVRHAGQRRLGIYHPSDVVLA